MVFDPGNAVIKVLKTRDSRFERTDVLGHEDKDLRSRCMKFASMRTRKGYYPTSSEGITFSIRPKEAKKRKVSEADAGGNIARRRVGGRGIDALHDDLLVNVMVAVSLTAKSPADLVNAMLVSKRFCAAATHPQVLARAGLSAFAVKASVWSEGAQRFLVRCSEVGNIEACYTLGMIRFYCLHDRRGGAALIQKAAVSSHAPALHSLAVIRFNGSEGSRKDKDLKTGAKLCAMAASLGHVDSMREFGHCLQDGYGVKKNVAEGRRLLLQANAREAAAAVAANPRAFVETALHLARNGGPECLHIMLDRYALNRVSARPAGASSSSNSPTLERHTVYKFLQRSGYSLLSDFGCNVPPAKLHISNKFLVDWFAIHPPEVGLRLCSHPNCGRPESRKHEFRRCSACDSVNYCSRACQALDWKLQHKYKCTPVADWEDREDNDAEDGNRLAVEGLYDS